MTLEERIKEIERFLDIKTTIDIEEIDPDLSDFCRKSDILEEGENIGSKSVAKKALSIIQELQNKFRQTLVEERLKIQDLRENVRELQAKNKELGIAVSCLNHVDYCLSDYIITPAGKIINQKDLEDAISDIKETLQKLNKEND